MDPEYLRKLIKNEDKILNAIEWESKLKQKLIAEGKAFSASLIDNRIKMHKERLKRIRKMRLRVLE